MSNSAQWLERRAVAEERAANFVERNHGPVLQMVAQAVRDLAPETADMSQVEADIRLAGEISFRIDNLINVPNPLVEALDGVIAWFAALAAIAVYRSVQAQMRNKGETLQRLETLLEERGEALTKRRRSRVERRIRRLRAVLQAVG